jgi:hypothetical protein
MASQITPRVQIYQRPDGWEFRLFTDDKAPLKFEGDHCAYRTHQEAEQAGYEAMGAFVRRIGWS